MEAKKGEDFQMTLGKTEEYAKFSMQFVKRGSPIPGLDEHKATLAEDAVAILRGRMTLDTAKKKSEAKIKELILAEVNMWDAPGFQQAAWDKFKQHPTFYLDCTDNEGFGGHPAMLLIQFSK